MHWQKKALFAWITATPIHQHKCNSPSTKMGTRAHILPLSVLVQ